MSLPRRALSGALTLLLAAVVIPVLAAPALAVSCGGSAQNGLAITPNHDATFYTDLGASPALDAAYLGYQVTNSGSARSNLWVQVSNFTGGSVTLADSTDDKEQIRTLASSASATRFFLAKASALSSSAQTHTVTVYDRRPDLMGATVIATCDFSFASVANTIAASANKVTAVTVSPSSPVVGGTVTVTVQGATGTSSGAMWISPAALSSWPSKALRLEGTTVDVNTDGSGPVEQTYSDSLYIPSSIASLYTSQTTYEARYVFRLTRATTTNPSVKPVAQISSGGQFKHTGSYPTLPVVAASTATASVTVAKAVTVSNLATLPTTTAPNGVSGATTYAEVPYRVTATSSGSSIVDEFVDVPATGMIFKQGTATYTDATPVTAAALADPVTSSADTGSRVGALHFTGPFAATSATSARVDYTMYVPLTAGSYQNQAFATLGGTSVGATSSSVPTVTVGTDGTSVTSATTGTSSTLTAQTITFTQPSTVALSSGPTTVSASSSSGLAVAVTSSTPSVCTVSGSTVTLVSSGICTLAADQAGNGAYAAATQVVRSFSVTAASQAITFAQPPSVSLSAGTATVAPTASSGLAVAVTSSTPSVCTVSGGTVTLVSVGTCTLAADQAGNGAYAAATQVVRSFVVSPVNQTITFAPPADLSVTAGTTTVSASATSGLPVTYTSTTPTICTVSGASVTLLIPGTCAIAADQSGDSTRSAAPTVTRIFQVAAAVPPPSAPTVATTGTGTATQSALVDVPAGGSVSLLDPAGIPVTSVVFPGQGTVLLDPSTGTISFVPVTGYVGTSTPVSYRVVDSFGRTAVATYSATVLAPASPAPVAPVPVAPAPVAPAPGVGVAVPTGGKTVAGLTLVTVSPVAGALPVTCSEGAGTALSCTVDVLAFVAGRWVVVGHAVSSANGLGQISVTVKLDAVGRALAAMPGGFAARVRATVTTEGATGPTTSVASTRARVVARQVVAPRPVFFDPDRWYVHTSDRRYLAGLRTKLAGVRVVTCIGHTDSQGSRAYDHRLGMSRAVAVCRRLTRGLKVTVVTVTKGELRPQAPNRTVPGRALNRRTLIRLTY